MDSNEESGYFGPVDTRAGGARDDRYHDFRQVYASRRGFARILTAKKNGRIFIFKCLRGEYAGNQIALAALRKEYECGYAVDSPYVVHTLDFDTVEGLGPAIRLEFCPGDTLADIIERGSMLPDSDIDRIVAALTAGVADIHAVGVVHRDIKPSNIIYSPATGSLRIIDFGSADALDFTILRGPAGTERFTPPDVADSSRPADAASDFYAVGVTLTRLCAVASPARRTALEYLASEMIARRITDRDAALALYRSRGKRRWKIGLAVAALVLALVVGLAVIFLPTEKEGEPVRPVQVTAETDTVAAPPETDVHEPVGKIAPAEPEAPAPAAESDEAEAEDEWPDFVLPDEKVRDQYGVTLAEAKYLPIFKKRPVDNFTVQRTDVMLQECIIIYNKSNNSDEERTRAYDRYYSPDAIPNDVIAEVMRKYPDADRRRVEGIARRRVCFWRDAFAPLEKHPSPALHDLKP